ncbi:MAG: type I polyketide synthase, partial [Cyanobacteria bacterium J06642_3]
MADYKVLMQKALSEIKDLRAQLQQEKDKNQEPIAIIGIGCRFPGGANSPEEFWELLANGVDAISEVPSDRWNSEDHYDANPVTPGKMYVRHGGFVSGLKEFDAEFFGISPREAISLDPQQRLLLEVTWEALERAGVVPNIPENKDTGVFVGITSSDYSQLLLERDYTEIDAYLATGNSHSTAAGRLSYLLGFTAPSMAIDTACSSSLVAVHLACKSLRDGECNSAVAGGVHRLIIPEFTINFSQARMLAPDGRCKTFDAAADGFSRAEGCGMVVLKRLANAEKDGDRILAVIRGSAVNQDGRSSSLTVPNGISQQRVINQALANSGVAAQDISYLETHGTGTSLGDPIEITALGEVFKRSSVNPLGVGSVKTNVGHLESAAGIAGLIKVVLSLQHKQIPPHLHFNNPNPHIDWDNLGVEVLSKGKEWQQDQPRLAGVSSFGFSGTNSHVVLGEYESVGAGEKGSRGEREQGREGAAVEARALKDTAPHIGARRLSSDGDKGMSTKRGEKSLSLLTLSAKSEPALQDLVKHYQKYLAHPSPLITNPSLNDICYTASAKRSHFDYRLAIIATDTEELKAQLAAFNQGEEVLGISQSGLSDRTNKIAFLFTGQGSQYIDMGRELYETQPVFKENCDRCFQLFNSYLDQPLQNIIFSSNSDLSSPSPLSTPISSAPQHPSTPALNQTQYTQPAIFTIEYALAQMWISWGIKPDVVTGHSIGEFVAAAIAQVFSLEDAIKLVANRGKLMQELPSNGEMYAIQAGEQEVSNVIKNISGTIAIAAINTPDNTVISGETSAISQAIAIFQQDEIKTTKLQISHAFHSSSMESILPAFTEVAESINYSIPQIPFVSNLTGARIRDALATVKYWVDHICQPVLFAQGMKSLAELKCNVFLEIGAKPILLGMGRAVLEAEKQGSKVAGELGSQGGSLWLPSLRSGQSDWRSLLASVANLYTNDINLDWAGFYQDKRPPLLLPTYPFQRQEYWLSGKKKRTTLEVVQEIPLLGKELKLANGEILGDRRIWQSQISAVNPRYLQDHQVGKKVLFPGAGYIEMALRVAKKVFRADCLEVTDLDFQLPLILSESTTEIQLTLEPEG